jgi:hypothetical protein
MSDLQEDQLNESELTARLKARADHSVGDIRLDHPGASDGIFQGFAPDDANRTGGARRGWALGVAATLMLVLAGGVYLMIGGDDSKPVQAPADSPVVPPDLGPIPDPATSSPEEVVRAAVERTAAVSWVGEIPVYDTVESNSGSPALVGETPLMTLYNPATDRGHGWTLMSSPDGEFGVPRPERSDSDQSRSITTGTGVRLGECIDEGPPCAEGKWYSFAQEPPLPKLPVPFIEEWLDPATATANGSGTYLVEAAAGYGETAWLVEIKDGFIRRMTEQTDTATTEIPASTVTFTRIGTAPRINLPGDSDIVEVDASAAEELTSDYEVTEEMAAEGSKPDCTLSVSLSPESASATPPPDMSIENEVALQLSSDRDEVATIDELMERAGAKDFVESVTGPAVGGCDLERLTIQVTGPAGTFMSGG